MNTLSQIAEKEEGETIQYKGVYYKTLLPIAFDGDAVIYIDEKLVVLSYKQYELVEDGLDER